MQCYRDGLWDLGKFGYVPPVAVTVPEPTETQTQAKGVRSAKGRESDSEPTRSESKGEARRVVRFGFREAEPLTGRRRSGEAGKWGGVGTLGEQGVQVALRFSVRRSFTSHSFVHSFTHSYVYLLTH